MFTSLNDDEYCAFSGEKESNQVKFLAWLQKLLPTPLTPKVKDSRVNKGKDGLY